MKTRIFLFVLLLLISMRITHTTSKRPISARREGYKSAPEYTGVDPILEPFVKNYIDLAAQHNIKFTKKVTIGFKVIKDPEDTSEHRTIGECNYAPSFREIDVDSEFFNKTKPISQKILLFHELTHCYCGRDHDYGKGEYYLPIELEKAVSFSFGRFWDRPAKPGYFRDECPLTIMAPAITTEWCIKEHETEYLNEMFDRCKPY